MQDDCINTLCEIRAREEAQVPWIELWGVGFGVDG